MPSPNVARAFLNQYKPPHNTGSEASTVPVAVFVGGTAGIGASIASELTQALKGDIDVFIVGRNVAAGQAVLDSLPSSTNTLQRIRKFVQCDATLMRDVIRAAHEIKAKAERINYLAMSQGMLSLQGRTESTEGIDAKLALHYYSRWKFTHEYVLIYISIGL
jgi:NAD(P)-dependent dehydrogenase (short-subunit alcohol dehydrogenase family)